MEVAPKEEENGVNASIAEKVLEVANDLISWKADSTLNHSKLVRASSRLLELGLLCENK